MTLGSLIVELAVDLSDLDKAGPRLQQIGGAMTSLGQAATVGVTIPIAAAAAAAVKFAVDFESAMTGVAKTVDATPAQIAAMGQEFRRLSETTGISANELAKVGESAGQLGIAKEDIVGFTKTMADLGVSTNLTADEAAVALARFSNITGTATSDVDRLGATLVALGNAGASTEKEIVEMGLRLAAAGDQIGLSEGEILGFANALSSVGVEAEAGGSAFSKLFINMASDVATGEGNLKHFADTAGLSVSDFQKAFRNDAAGAITAFIEGLGAMDTQSGETLLLLEEMGIEEVRLRDSILRAAGASDTFSASLEDGNKAWADNTALANEANRFYATTANQFSSLKNEAVNVAAEFGAVLLPAFQALIKVGSGMLDVVRVGVDLFAKMPAPVQGAVVAVVALVAAVGPLLVVVGAAASVFTALSGAAGILGVSIGALVTPVAVGVAAFAAIVTAAILVANNWDELSAKTKSVFKAIGAAVAKALNAVGEKLDWILGPISALGLSVSDMVNAVVGFFGNLLAAVLLKVEDIATGITDWLVEGLKPLATWIWDRVLNPVVTKFTGFLTSVVGIAEKVYNGVKLWLVDKFTGIVDGIKRQLDKVTGFFEGMSDWLVGNSVVPDMVDAIGAEFDRMANDMTAATVLGVQGSVAAMEFMETRFSESSIASTDAVSSTFGDLAKTLPEDVAKLVSAVGREWGAIADKLSIPLGVETAKSLKEWADFAIEFISTISSIWNAVGKIIDKIGGVFAIQSGPGGISIGISGAGAGGGAPSDLPGTGGGSSIANDLIGKLLDGSRVYWTASLKALDEVEASIHGQSLLFDSLVNESRNEQTLLRTLINITANGLQELRAELASKEWSPTIQVSVQGGGGGAIALNSGGVTTSGGAGFEDEAFGARLNSVSRMSGGLG